MFLILLSYDFYFITRMNKISYFKLKMLQKGLALTLDYLQPIWFEL